MIKQLGSMPMKITRSAVFFVFTATFAFGAEKKNEKNLAPHVHGEGKLRFVLDYEKQEAQLNFQFPALQVLGFEHKPKTEAEKKIHKDSHALLKKPTSIFTLITATNAKSDCSFGKSTLKIPYMDDHAHNHGHSHGDHDHADYELEYSLRCKNLKAVQGIKLEAFKNLKNLEKLKVEGFAGEKPVAQEIKAAQPDLLF